MNGRQLNPPDTCPVANICRVTAGPEAPVCGSDRAHLPPLLFAEESCVLALRGAHDYLLGKTYEHKPSMRSRLPYYLAWSFLEQAEATPKLADAEMLFNACTERVTEVVDNPQADPGLRTEAALLRAYIPRFKDRRLQIAPGAAEVLETRQGLAESYSLLQVFTQESRGKFDKDAHQVVRKRIAIMLAAARGGTLVYPSSPREAQFEHLMPWYSIHQALSGGFEKHDSYMVDDSGQKIPLKINGASKNKYSARVLKIDYHSLIEATVHAFAHDIKPGYRQQYVEMLQTGYTQDTFREYTPDLLAAEAKGLPLQPSAQYFLDGLTATFRHLVGEHQRQLAPAVHKPLGA